MICPHCKHSETQVLDSRDAGEGIRRRRECLQCAHRFTTYERVEPAILIVEKKNGNKERFNADKLKRGMQLACKNRPVSSAQIDEAVEGIEHKLAMLGKDQVTSKEIGLCVQDALQRLDQVAYIRFTSVYQEFSNVQQFEEAVQTID